MTKPDGKATLATGAGAGALDARQGALVRRAEAVSEEKPSDEKPRASEEIVIEEISIDGMCGVY